ncbi:MAG: GDP-mannose 4,6-dehydratase [Novosphingobium sp.]
MDRSIVGSDAFIETNVFGTHALLKAVKTVWLDRGSGQPHRFHHVSTDEVFGTLGANDPAFIETDRYAPNSPYAASKAASDHLVRSFHRTFGLQVTTSHCSNNYGPYQFPEKLIPRFLINALHGKNLPIFGDGQQIRDWLYVDDHCRGIDLILARGNIGETYNIGGRSELPNLEIIDTLCEKIDEAFLKNRGLIKHFPDAPPAKGQPTSSLKKHISDRPGHDRRYAIDEAKICSELGFEPKHGFDIHLSKTVDWYLANKNWWQHIVDKNWGD